MSYPLHAVPKAAPGRNVCSEVGFWGLDQAGGAISRPISRAADTENLFWSGNALKRRPGYGKVGSFQGRINGIFFWSNQRIIHAGNRLYRQLDKETPQLIYEGMKDAPSFGTLRRQTLVRRWCDNSVMYGWHRESRTGDFLFINDGQSFLFYDGQEVCSVADYHWGESLRVAMKEGAVYSFYADVPISVSGKLPSGEGGDADPRGDNRLSQFRCESFYVSDETECTEFILNYPYGGCNEGIPTELQLRDSDGIWRSYSCISKDFYLNSVDGRTRIQIDTPIIGGMDFSYDREGRIVNLGYGSHQIANDGMDNLRITYAVFKDPPDALTGATVGGLYGPDGTEDVLFLGGSEASPGEDAFSKNNDFFCFYSTSVERLGSIHVPITGYCRLPDGRMAVLKNDPDAANVYFRSHTTVSVGSTQSGAPYRVDAFPSVVGAAVEGCIAPRSVGIAGNEPIFLAPSGLYSVRSVSDELTNLNETIRRSIPIDPLLSAQNAADARSVVWRGCYLLTFGSLGFITDGRRDSSGALRFLKWRFAHDITALGKQSDILWLGDSAGNLYRLETMETDNGTSFEAYWQTYLPPDKGGHRQLLKQLSAAVCPAWGGRLSAVLYREQTPAPRIALSAHRTDFSAWDFSKISFDGSHSMRWLNLPFSRGGADSFALRLYIDEGSELLLWGLRMIYEKGGTM